MAKINFYLNNKIDNKGYSIILLYFSFKELRIPISTNERIPEKVWNKKTQKFRL
jgi:hypothetical protein